MKNRVSKKETLLISKMLDSPDDSIVKSAIQKICENLENGKIFDNIIDIQRKITHTLFSDNAKIRRWAYKFFSLNNSRINSEHNNIRKMLVDSLNNLEEDEENNSWIVTAIFAMHNDSEILDLIKKKQISTDELSYSFSSQLFYTGKIKSKLTELKTLELIESDPLSAKWEALLYGYQKSHRINIPQRFDSKDLIINLTDHHEKEVSEYAVWSLHKSPENSYIDIQTKIPTLLSKSEDNVRRWIYRLITKDKKSVIDNIDLIKHAIKNEKSIGAREGLALGLIQHYSDNLSNAIIEWYSIEKTGHIKDLILEHMSRFCNINSDYFETVFETAQNEGISSLRSQRIITSLANFPNADKIKRKIINDQHRQLDLYYEETQDQEKRESTMTTTINVKGDLIAPSSNFGEVKDTKNSFNTQENTTIEKLSSEYYDFINNNSEISHNQKELLLELLSELKKSQDSEKSNILDNLLTSAKDITPILEKTTNFVNTVSNLIY